MGPKMTRTKHTDSPTRHMERGERTTVISTKGVTPLGYMLSVLSDEGADVKRRDDMAKAAAPYIHPRLASLDHNGQLSLSHEEALDELS